MDSFEITAMLIKVVVMALVLLHVTPVMIWVERRVSAWMQNRTGPNRVGPFGLLQPMADAIKFIFKEDLVPGHVRKSFYLLAPGLALVPALITFCVIPVGPVIEIFGRKVALQVADINVGFVFITAISSLAVYGTIVASWASNSKYAMLGGLRSTAQMISYELAMGLALLAVIIQYGSVSLQDIALAQAGPLTIKDHTIGFLPNWGVFLQPIAFLIYFISSYAETNRLPFDLPEGEAEIVAGYHLEYGGMKFGMFFMAEYIHMVTASSLATAIFFGGWQMLPGMELLLNTLNLPAEQLYWATVLSQVASFVIKVSFFMVLFVVVRFSLPRFRYDQLMYLGWKILVPLALLNVVVTASLMAAGIY